MKLKHIVLALTLASGLLGCQSQFEFSPETQYGALRPDAKEKMQALRGNTYVREIRTEDAARRKPVFLSKKGIPCAPSWLKHFRVIQLSRAVR